MKLFKFAVPCMALLLAAAPTLRADTVSGSIWIVPTLAGGTLPAPGSSIYGTTPTFTFTLNNASGSVFNMNSNNASGDYTVNGFLTSGGDTVTYATSAEQTAALTQLLNTPAGCHEPTPCSMDAVAPFTGTIQSPVAAGKTIFHDDGFILTVGGVTEASFPNQTDEEMNTLGAIPA